MKAASQHWESCHHHLQREVNAWKHQVAFLLSYSELWHSWEEKANLQLSRHIPYPHNVLVLHQQSEGVGILRSTARPHPLGALSASHHAVHTYGCLAEASICSSVPIETSPPPPLPQWRWQEELTQTKSRTRNRSMDLGTGPHNKSTVGSVSLASHQQHYCCDNTEAFWFPSEQSILASWLCFGEMSNNLSNATSTGQRILGRL